MRQMLIAVLLLVPAFSTAQDTRRDGNWWNQESNEHKVYFMAGFFDGMDLGNNFSYWGMSEKGKDGGCDDQAVRSYNDQSRKFFPNVTNVQLVEGLDTFYKDYRNRSIRIKNAVWLVVNGIAGTPQDKLDKMIENYRKNASSD